jgi:hypothetical protein
MELEEYLTLPLQRIQTYVLMLEELLQYSFPGEDDYRDLTLAKDRLSEAIAAKNDFVGAESYTKGKMIGNCTEIVWNHIYLYVPNYSSGYLRYWKHFLVGRVKEKVAYLSKEQQNWKTWHCLYVQFRNYFLPQLSQIRRKRKGKGKSSCQDF